MPEPINHFAQIAAAHRALADAYDAAGAMFAGPHPLPPVDELDESGDDIPSMVNPDRVIEVNGERIAGPQAQTAWIAPAHDPDITRIATEDQVRRIDAKWPRLSVDEWEGGDDPLKPKVIANIQRELAESNGSGASNGTGTNGTNGRRSDPPPPAAKPTRFRLPGDPP